MRDAILTIKNARRIAVMGGTFDPVHYGHLVTAEAVRNAYAIDCVVFIPTGRAPHKQDNLVAHPEHRYLMTMLATYNNPYFEVSRMEIDRGGMSYTIDTVRELRSVCRADAKIYFITGADAVHQILTWKDSETLLGLCSFVAVTRPGYHSGKLYEEVVKIKNQNQSKIHFLEVPALAISSSDIRERVRAEKPIKYLLPEEVERYIEKFRLYADAERPDKSGGFNRKEIEKRLKKDLTDKRYLHTQGVAEEAAKLAERYGADKEKAVAAALLHDCAKCLSDSQILKQCKEYGIALDKILKARPMISHGFLGAAVAKAHYHINDAEVLDAISYHTTGKAGMTTLGKIIYVADCIEPNRDPYPGLEAIRKLAYVDLDRAVIKALENTIEENKAKNELIHPLSYDALNDLLSKGDHTI